MTGRDTRRDVHVFVCFVALVGTLSLGAVLYSLPWGGLGDLRVLGLCMFALVFVNIFPIEFAWKGERENVSVDEAFCVVLLMLSPPPAVALGMMFSTTVFIVHHRLPPVKAAFNVGMFSMATSVALLVSSAISGHPPVGSSPLAMVAAGAGAISFYVATTLGVRAVVALSAQMRFLRLFARMSSLEVVILATAISLGLLCGLAGSAQPWALPLALPPLGVIGFVLHQHGRAVRDRVELDRLLETAVAANQAVGAKGVHEVLTEAAASLLHTDDARLQAEPPSVGALGSAVLTDSGTLWLVAGPRPSGERSTAEQQRVLDAIAAVGASALGAAALLDRVTHQAFHDSLTGLPNRLLFEDRANQALRGRGRRTVALLYLDLDRFKRVNDNLGHHAGDSLLVRVAERLQGSLRACDSAGRVGGDEFVVLLPDLDDEAEAAAVAARVHRVLRDPFVIDGREITVTTSVGVAIAPHDGADYESLLRSADRAMYEAKDAGRNAVRRASPNTGRDSDLALELELRQAIERGELWVAYQPQVDLRTRQVIGTEALVRWLHPTRGPMRPDQFLPLAEELGLLGTIDAWVLKEACRQTATWRSSGAHPQLRVAVNFSAGPLRSDDLEELVLRTLRNTGLPPGALELEVTEQVAGVDGAVALATLSRLREIGVRIAIDDFGTGYSSLSRLRTLPVDVVKIDQSFVREIVDASTPVPLVTGTLTLASALGLQVVAEGIETATQLAFLAEHGCDVGQGYLLGRPMPAPDVELGRHLHIAANL